MRRIGMLTVFPADDPEAQARFSRVSARTAALDY
jgi:hypothetical protein